MDVSIKGLAENMRAKDRDVQGAAYRSLMELTETPVDWAYDIWDDLRADLTHKDNHVRAIAAQVLCNLAKSDPQGRILTDFQALLDVTRDERFVTARHCLLSLWKIGAVGPKHKQVVIDGLTGRYLDCVEEKNGTLIRYDIIVGFKNLYDLANDETLRAKALELIEREEDPKYRKKYAGVWKAR